MARFVFRLEPVLSHRERRQEEAEEALAAARREREESARALEGHRIVLAESLREETVDLTAALHLQFYREHLVRRGRDLSAALDATEQAVQEKLQLLVVARQEKKALENLKEHRRQAFEAEQRRREQKVLDEIGMRTSSADDKTIGERR